MVTLEERVSLFAGLPAVFLQGAENRLHLRAAEQNVHIPPEPERRMRVDLVGEFSSLERDERGPGGPEQLRKLFQRAAVTQVML